MSTPSIGFDLLEQPWIRANDRDGRPRTLSLREVFRYAHELSALTGEVPTQSLAILRLLLAILHRSVKDRTGVTAEIWGDLWRTETTVSGEKHRTLPLEEIDRYLTDNGDRFGLFDPKKPFFQVAGLRSEKDAVSGLDKLIADVPNGEKYFTTRAGVSVDRIDFAEAARWLVHVHAFDPSGIKTGAVGDPRVKKGKGYPIGVAWTGCLGGVFLEGATLRETLLLNLVLRDMNAERFSDNDFPPWEREPDGAAARGSAAPTGPVDLCTWQSRRVRLVHDGTHVTGVVLCNGDALEPFNQQRSEPMTGWRFSELQTKKAGQARHYPMTHEPERALWRGLASLIGEVANPTGTGGRAIAPGVIEWLSYLVVEDELDPTHPVRLHATGMQYINNQSVVGDIFDDAIGFRVALLSADPELRTLAVNAVQVADNAVYALATLAGNLATAAGGESDGARGRAKERGYFALDEPYRRWLAALKPAGAPDYDEYDAGWARLVRSVIEPLGADLIASAGLPAWVGREARGHYIDSSQAARWFRRRLEELLPAAYPRSADEGGSAA
ncbi:type I-E CRISPR-associated protein Cse1/CasA (plasmid) [Nocardia sp. CWNU-33]|uniref:type I-E CRISPR-associated protein Cse1/CasA n=1 Tax=Nocardia sp. CWNU-33 TaxID=3392117 RepID=UPI00398F70A8